MITLIHSDDMAATPHVTEDMLRSWREGTLDGFSVIANGTARDAVARALQAEPNRAVRIVVHLNLSEGPSSAPPELVPLLVDGRGILKHTFTTLLRAWHGSSAAAKQRLGEQIAREWSAQIAEVQRIAAPRSVAGVDGHMHVHMPPFLFDIAARLAAGAGIPSIRISREPFYLARARDLIGMSYYVNALKQIVLRLCAPRAAEIARRHGLSAADRIVGVLYTGRMTAARARAGIAAAKRSGAMSTEVLFHVGRADETERERWTGRAFIGDFYLSPWRDVERREAAALRAQLQGKAR